MGDTENILSQQY